MESSITRDFIIIEDPQANEGVKRIYNNPIDPPTVEIESVLDDETLIPYVQASQRKSSRKFTTTFWGLMLIGLLIAVFYGSVLQPNLPRFKLTVIYPS